METGGINDLSEITFTIKDADLDKLNKVLKDVNVKECPYFEVQDKYGNVAKYYRKGYVPDTNVGDMISRQAAIDATYAETVSTNPEHFKSSKKFIGYMDDIDISDFGRWQWANGFNTALVAIKIKFEKLPSAEPQRKNGKWIDKSGDIEGAWNYCSVCGEQAIDLYDFCPNCGADMRGEQDD